MPLLRSLLLGLEPRRIRLRRAVAGLETRWNRVRRTGRVRATRLGTGRGACPGADPLRSRPA
ncbi:Uncharacterised protein [Nocardia otitidiscaviarum]|uniref:Uncharacterized protein n=1 Tax=Nocardia otitidiscaviarum TaxID=1823 RepID=A0A378YJY1_9NOCA|nr:Uncharacterised protein [Nocardia otitidiscaviarum]